MVQQSLQSPKAVNKMLADKDGNFNRILSQNVKMSLNFRRLKLNGNILICGGSGAGKTFYEVKPNLMQMPHHCSFICTDPKGEILRSCGHMLKDNGYLFYTQAWYRYTNLHYLYVVCLCMRVWISGSVLFVCYSINKKSIIILL